MEALHKNKQAFLRVSRAKSLHIRLRKKKFAKNILEKIQAHTLCPVRLFPEVFWLSR
jgi:hypothetical protein